MKLRRARVTHYKSIDDSGWVDLDLITCMLGKNESGKTAFLSALRRLSPVMGDTTVFELTDYPRKDFVSIEEYMKKILLLQLLLNLNSAEKRFKR